MWDRLISLLTQARGNETRKKPTYFEVLTSEEKTKITHHWLDHTLKSVSRTVKLFKLSDSEKCGFIYETTLTTSPL